jgi:hypothetical protein
LNWTRFTNLKSCVGIVFQINCVHKLNLLLDLQIWFNWSKEKLIYPSRFFSWDYGYFEIIFNRMKVIKHLKEIYVSMIQFNVLIKLYSNEIWNFNLIYINIYIMMHQNQIFSNFTIDFNLSYMWFCTFDHKIISFNLIFFNENYYKFDLAKFYLIHRLDKIIIG